MKFTFLFILTLLVLTSYSQQPLVKKRSETTYWTYNDSKGKKKTQKQLEGFIVYDQQRREIEHGYFGESSGTQVIDKDSSISWFCTKDYSKLNTVDSITYDQYGRKLKEETWFYKDNKKSWTSGYITFKYNDLGLLLKEIHYSEQDRIDKTVTYIYDNNLNNIEIIDSSLKLSYLPNKLSIHKSVNKFDTLKRIILTTEFSNEELLLRRKFLYSDGTDLITELRYENGSDTSLWSITETKAGDIEQFPYPNKKLEKFTKIINSKTDTREIYLYDKNSLLKKIEIYSGINLTGYSEFTYEYY